MNKELSKNWMKARGERRTENGRSLEIAYVFTVYSQYSFHLIALKESLNSQCQKNYSNKQSAIK